MFREAAPNLSPGRETEGSESTELSRAEPAKTGKKGMELSPKGQSFGDGSARKRTVQEASRHVGGVQQLLGPKPGKTIEHGARASAHRSPKLSRVKAEYS